MSDNIDWVTGSGCNDGSSTYHRVGNMGITKIDDHEEILGTYSIKWYRIYKGDVVVSKMNALYVAEVGFVRTG